MSPSYGVGVSHSLGHAAALAMAQQCRGAILVPRGRIVGIGDRIVLPCRMVIVFPDSRLKLLPADAKPRKVEHEFYEDEDYDRDSSVEDNDSMVLLLQLVRTILRKMSIRATRAARKMLPPIFTSDLISFFVNGALLLTVFWVAKALLEVVCSMGSMLFIGLLFVRSVWSILSYSQTHSDSYGGNSNGNSRSSGRSNNRTGGDYDDYQFKGSPS